MEIDAFVELIRLFGPLGIVGYTVFHLLKFTIPQQQRLFEKALDSILKRHSVERKEDREEYARIRYKIDG